ncbi:MAG: STAS domain-containing protein [Rhodobacterales bacterium]
MTLQVAEPGNIAPGTRCNWHENGVNCVMGTTINFHALSAQRPRQGEDPLMTFLQGVEKGPVTLSVRDVHRVDAYRLQILISAERQWQIDGLEFQIIDMSPAFRSGLERLGLSPDHFDKEAQQ